MRRVAIVTVGRSDYGLYVPILRAVQRCEGLSAQLLVSGAHLSPEFGLTVQDIEADGYPIADRIEMLLSSDSPQGIARSIGLGVIGFAQSFATDRPDMLMVLGDRFEMYAAALAALPFKIPVAHIHGGENTCGAIDESLRHSMTKLSHLHFVATDEYADRVEQLGEEKWRIVVSGAPGLDNLSSTKLLDPAALEQRFGLRVREPFVLVTFHPVTLEFEQTEMHVESLLEAVDSMSVPVIFTKPNADTYGRVVDRLISDFVRTRALAQYVENLGTQGYFSLMALAAVMAGNSSSGIIEATSFDLPVVNIGNRQLGRVRAGNVIDVGYHRGEIAEGLSRALSLAFRRGVRGLTNPYGTGNAAERIVTRLKSVPLDRALVEKRFRDIPRNDESDSVES